jgi:hypothetical protein
MKNRIWAACCPRGVTQATAGRPTGAMNDTRGPTSRDRFVTGPVTAERHLKGACSALIVTGVTGFLRPVTPVAWKGRDKPAINRCMQVPDRAAHAAFAGWCSSAARCCSLRVRTAVTRWRALCDDQGGSPLDAWSARPYPVVVCVVVTTVVSSPSGSCPVSVILSVSVRLQENTTQATCSSQRQHQAHLNAQIPPR